jgi:hypothetical protein
MVILDGRKYEYFLKRYYIPVRLNNSHPKRRKPLTRELRKSVKFEYHKDAQKPQFQQTPSL